MSVRLDPVRIWNPGLFKKTITRNPAGCCFLRIEDELRMHHGFAQEQSISISFERSNCLYMSLLSQWQVACLLLHLSILDPRGFHLKVLAPSNSRSSHLQVLPMHLQPCRGRAATCRRSPCTLMRPRASHPKDQALVEHLEGLARCGRLLHSKMERTGPGSTATYNLIKLGIEDCNVYCECDL